MQNLADLNALSYIRTKTEQARNDVTKRNLLYDRLYGMWRCVREGKAFPWRANVFNPISFYLIETVLPKIMLAIYTSSRELLDVAPVDEADIDAAKASKKLVNYQLLVEMNMFLDFCKFHKSNLTYGSAVAKVGWDKKEKRPDFEYVPLKSFLYDDKATNWKDCEWGQQEIDRDIHYLLEKEEEEVYTNIKDDIFLKVQNADKARPFKLSEWWGKIPAYMLKDNNGKDTNGNIVKGYDNELVQAVVTICEDVVIRRKQNPFKHKRLPFLWGIDHIDLEALEGFGELEPIESLQAMASDLFCQYLDSRNQEINNMWVAQRNAGIDFKSLVNKPGGIVLTNDVNSVKEIRPRNQTGSIIADENFLFQLVSTGTGISPLSAGLQVPKAPETATGTELLQSAAGQRIAFKLLVTNWLVLKPLGEMVLSLDAQYMPPSKAFRILGDDEFTNVSKNQVAVKRDLIPMGSLMQGSAEMQSRDVMGMMGILARSGYDIRPLVKYLFELRNIRVDSDKIFPPQKPTLLNMPEQPGGQTLQGGGGVTPPGAPAGVGAAPPGVEGLGGDQLL